jgi:hypothetical protein
MPKCVNDPAARWAKRLLRKSGSSDVVLKEAGRSRPQAGGKRESNGLMKQETPE